MLRQPRVSLQLQGIRNSSPHTIASSPHSHQDEEIRDRFEKGLRSETPYGDTKRSYTRRDFEEEEEEEVSDEDEDPGFVYVGDEEREEEPTWGN